ncbi:MAG: hypothetical protein DIZ80_00470 [endosymbiont of Galathealinum brachiosum]|uniref:Uncharacterized protein n=1 Tax=endosymbiont of Galathealinum brachiosum TaxID=2200906 RepID=A0A370DM48_9GAMM|nr:MAG: hypothetical protein DIZ80_00470 [endosymbiont of Galathealinum brachiosum]
MQHITDFELLNELEANSVLFILFGGAQHNVFTLLVVKAYIDGMNIAEEVRAFSLKQLAQAMEQPCTMRKESCDLKLLIPVKNHTTIRNHCTVTLTPPSGLNIGPFTPPFYPDMHKK